MLPRVSPRERWRDHFFKGEADILHDALIIGGGPAGASCALWLKKLGHAPLLVDARDRLGGLLLDSPYRNDWIATSPPADGRDIAATIHRNVEEAEIAIDLATSVSSVARTDDRFRIETATREARTARHVVLATGVRAATGGIRPARGIVFGPGPAIAEGDFSRCKVALLGGGDNAFENFLYVSARGADARIFARHVGARKAFRDRVPPARLSVGDYAVDEEALTVEGETFDMIAVFYGWEPVLPGRLDPVPAMNTKGYIATDQHCRTSIDGLFAIGEMAGRMHPSVVTAMADGVVAAKRIAALLEAR